MMKAFRRPFHFSPRRLSLLWFCHRFGIATAVATGILTAASFSPLHAQEFKPFDQFLNVSTRVLVGSGDSVASARAVSLRRPSENVSSVC